MPRLLYWLPCLIVACTPPSSPPPAASVAPAVPAPEPFTESPSWTSLRAAARRAHLSHDDAAYRDALRDLLERSGSSRLLQGIAVVEERLGHRPEALARLTELAALGLALEDPPASLDALRADPRFAPIGAAFEQSLTPVAQAEVAFELPADNLITEGLAYDEASKTFFVGSVRKRKILAVGPDGAVRDVVANDPELASACGLAVAGGKLWVASAELPPMIGYVEEHPHPTALLAYDLRTFRRVEVARLDRPGKHALTDLTVGSDGVPFASDSLGGGVYDYAGSYWGLQPFVPEGVFTSPQTPACLPGSDVLLVPDYTRGIARLDRLTRRLSWLTRPDHTALNGIDGMALVGSSLFVVQNGVYPERVERLELDPSGERVLRAEVVERRAPGFGDATHGVVAAGAFYFISGSGWARFEDSGALKKDAPKDAPKIMRIPLAR